MENKEEISVMIKVTPTLRQELNVLKAKTGHKSLNNLIINLIELYHECQQDNKNED